MLVNLEELKRKFEQVSKDDREKLATLLERTINFLSEYNFLNKSASSQLEESIQFDDEYLQQSFLTNLNNQINGVINGNVDVDFALGEFKDIKEILDEVIDGLDKIKINEKFLGFEINSNEMHDILNSLDNSRKNSDVSDLTDYLDNKAFESELFKSEVNFLERKISETAVPKTLEEIKIRNNNNKKSTCTII
jgi:hypothetical protein